MEHNWFHDSNGQFSQKMQSYPTYHQNLGGAITAKVKIKLKPVVETYWPQSVGLVIAHASLFTP